MPVRCYEDPLLPCAAVAVVPGTRLRRTWPQRLLIGFNVLLILACLLAASGLGYFYWRFGQLPRVELGKILTPEPEDPGEPFNFLIVGSDTRSFVEDSQDRESFGDTGLVGGERSDTIIVVRVDPRSEKAAMISFPRDLRVQIAGTNRRTRINEAFQGGGREGAQRLIETIQQNFAIPIHHYAQIDFAGFRGLVSAVGGVEMYFPAPARDRVTGLDIPNAGCVELDGTQALAFVRSRHYQFRNERGRWQTDPTGDLGRIQRQQDFIRRAIREALSKGLLNPNRLLKLVNVAIDNVTVDKGLSAGDIVKLGRRFRSLAPDTIDMYSLPVRNINVGGAAMLALEEDKAEPIFAVFRGAQAGEVQPSGVSVRVLNGTGVGGQAGRVSRALSLLQFNVAGIGNGNSTETTVIRFGPGQGPKAQLLARYLDATPALVADPFLEGVDLVMTTGSDFNSVLEQPKPADQAPPLPPEAQQQTTTTSSTPPSSGGQAPPPPPC